MGELQDLLPYLKMWQTYVDIGIIAFIIYKAMNLIRETRAEQLLKGIVLLIIATKVSEFLQLHAVFWLLKNTMTVGVIAILIIFQPELRRVLEHLGRGKFFAKHDISEEDVENMIDEIVSATGDLSRVNTGALIVLEREIGLNEYIETGTPIDAVVTSRLLENVFVPNTPLHDGALIIRKNRIVAASCYLPLTQSQHLNKDLGTRHRAAIGITEISDSIVIIVSEETGVVSLAIEGKIQRYLDAKALKELIMENYIPKEGRQYIPSFRRNDKNA